MRRLRFEQRRAKPQVALTPGWSYQYQRSITGFRNGSLLGVGVGFSLPISDRNQGNIRKAQRQAAEAQHTYRANVAGVQAEVEILLAAYSDAVDDVVEYDDPALLRAAALRKAMEEEFEADERRLTELIDARAASAERRVRYVEFQANYRRTLNRLNTVVGLHAYDRAAQPIEYGADKKEPDKKCRMESAPATDGKREDRP